MSPLKKCAVCGDKALGYNFNAVTCESCKAFFRRNALAKKQFTCPFNENCEMNVVTRRFCQKCRLKKCLTIGMKSENIMSEEDKLIKRRKIETNRAKRRLNEQNDKISESDAVDVKHESVAADSSGFDASHDSQSSFDSAIGGTSSNGPAVGAVTAALQSVHTISSTALLEPLQDVNPELLTSEELVEFIVGDSDRASQAISKVMRTPAEAVRTVEKIINSQKDALRLISHLIAFPGDALKIISKIMNSPFDALTVFTKFMSSPTDGLEIISKVVSSPQDVLQFIRNLMDSPEDGIDIMNKFMNTPAEALKILNKIFNGPNSITNTEDSDILMSAENESAFQISLATSVPLPPPPPPLPPPPPPSPLSTALRIQVQSPTVLENTDTLLHSILNNSPNASQSKIILYTPPSSQSPTLINGLGSATSPASTQFTPSPQAMSLTSPPVSVTPVDMQYHSPASMHSDELPSTSTAVGLISSTPMHDMVQESDADFANDNFDIKSFISNTFPDNNSNSSTVFDSINSLESVLTEVIRIEYQAFNHLPPESRVKQEQHTSLPSTPCNDVYHHNANVCNPRSQPICATSTSMIKGRDLNEAEQMKLRELKLASEALFYPVDDDLSALMMGDDRIKPGDTHQDPKLLQVINLTAVAIKRLIKMAKKITAFRDMCQEDQVALLKGGCTEMMIMRSAMIYDDDRNTWKIPHTKENMSNIRADLLKLAKGNVYEEHLKFISTFDEKWRMDENIILIMCAIVLFTPTRQRIIHSDVIRLEQNSYYYLLRRYLESVYPGCEAKSAFIRLIQKVSDVERLNQVIIGVYLNVNPSQVEPLLREIFDLKNH